MSDPVSVPGVGAGGAGGAGGVLSSCLGLCSREAAGVPVGACLRFTRCRVWCFFLLYGKIQTGLRVFGFC